MNIFHAIILGVVQGVTEFLPISSSAHLIILPRIFSWKSPPLVFDAILHLGTGFALLIVCWGDIWGVLRRTVARPVSRSLCQGTEGSRSTALTGMIPFFIALLPAGLLGFFFGDFFEESFRGGFWVVLFLVLGSILMGVVSWWGVRRGALQRTSISALLIGLFQAMALFPGMSRSGSTISGGILVGLSREDAARFSFLLAIPLSFAAGVYEGFSSAEELLAIGIWPLIAGLLSSFGVGVLCAKFLLKFLKSYSLWVFIVYRVILAGVLLVLL